MVNGINENDSCVSCMLKDNGKTGTQRLGVMSCDVCKLLVFVIKSAKDIINCDLNDS